MTGDEALYQQYLAGEDAAADALVARYGDALTLYIHGFLGDLQEAEDLMIEAFALMFAKPRPVCAQGSFKGYLFRIGRNLAGRHRKKQRLRQQKHRRLWMPSRKVMQQRGKTIGSSRMARKKMICCSKRKRPLRQSKLLLHQFQKI